MGSRVVYDLYQQYAPRWFKVIRWRDFAQRTIETQRKTWPMYWLPLYYAVFSHFNPYPTMLCIYQPQTDEERLELKRDSMIITHHQRDWEMGQYNHEIPPHMDVWKRRQKHPEYYGDKYNKFHMDGTW